MSLHAALVSPLPPFALPRVNGRGLSLHPAAGTFEEKSISLAWVQEQLGALLGELRHSHQGAAVTVSEVTSCRQAVGTAVGWCSAWLRE